MRLRLALSAALLASPACAAENLTVVELFTSQGCSSCPPADALLTELGRADPALLPLDLHVTYWDRLGWKDPFSLPAVTERQRSYAERLGLDTVYTPQMVIAGRHDVVGSDRSAVLATLAEARAEAPPPVPLRLIPDPAGLRVEVGAGPGDGTLLLVGYDPQHATPVRTGENGGRTLHEVNVVRGMAPAGAWHGAPVSLTAPRPAGERVAVLLQGTDGRILAAATLE